eukprot:5046646-Pyramimonas_sp.AAC.1
MSGGACLVLSHRAYVISTPCSFLEHSWVLKTFRGRTIGMPGRSVPAQWFPLLPWGWLESLGSGSRGRP